MTTLKFIDSIIYLKSSYLALLSGTGNEKRLTGGSINQGISFPKEEEEKEIETNDSLSVNNFRKFITKFPKYLRTTTASEPGFWGSTSKLFITCGFYFIIVEQIEPLIRCHSAADVMHTHSFSQERGFNFF